MLSSMGMRQPFFPSSLRNRKGVHSLTWMGIIASRGCESRNPQHMRRTMVVNARKSNLVTAGNFPSSVGLVSWKRALCCESNDKNEVQMVEGQDGRERLPEISPDDVVDGKVGLIKKRICGYSGDIDMPAPQVEEEVANDRFVWRSPTPRTGRVSGDIVDIPVIPRRELNAEEVISALEANGAMEVRIVNLKGKSTICDAMIFCTAKSVPHMRRLCDVLTRSMKKRGLRQAPGYTGAEGYDCHDWMLVDTNNMIIQIMDTETRDIIGHAMEKEWNELSLPEARGYGDSYEADPPSKNRGKLKHGRSARRKWDMVPDYDDENEGYEFDVVHTLTPQEEEEAYKNELRKRVKEAKQRAAKMRSAQMIGESAEKEGGH